MAFVKPSWTDPNTGATYANVYLRVVRAVVDLEANAGNGFGELVVAVYATKAARNAGRNPLTRFTVNLLKRNSALSVAGIPSPVGADFDFTALNTVFGAPVAGLPALARWNALMLAVYTWIKDPANAAAVGFDLTDATDDT